MKRYAIFMKNSTGPVVVFSNDEVILEIDGAPVDLTGPQRRVLGALARDPHRVRTKAELLQSGWGRADGTTRPVDTTAVRLRRLLTDAGADRWAVLVNVWGVGYRLQDPKDETLTIEVR